MLEQEIVIIFITAFQLSIMTRKTIKKERCYTPTSTSELTIEAIVNIDERGQMVLPKEIREMMELHIGSKLALVTKEEDGRLCCIFLFKVEELAVTVQNKLRSSRRESD